MNVTPPPNATAHWIPTSLVTNPISGEPNAPPPIKNIMYIAMTRPRICGSTVSWTDALAEIMKYSEAIPVGMSAIANQ